MKEIPILYSDPPEVDAKKKLSVEMIVAYLDKQLRKFPKFLKEKYKDKKKSEREVRISQILCPFLRNYREVDEYLLFDFEREWNYEDSARSSDFAIIDVKKFKKSQKLPQPIFTIEAKRLPTTGTDKKTKKSRKKEYVEGNLGGIERYKRGHHGKDLPKSAIVGYVQKENCSHWQTEINKWIDALIANNTDTTIQWNSSDLLKEVSDFGKTRKYYSKNARIINSKRDSIELHHYLMELN